MIICKITQLVTIKMHNYVIYGDKKSFNGM